MVDFRQVERVTHLFARPPFDVAQRDHGPLARGQRLDRASRSPPASRRRSACPRGAPAAATPNRPDGADGRRRGSDPASTAASGTRAGSCSAENGMLLPSRCARVFAVLTRMRNTHVLSDDLPSNRSRAPRTRSHVSWTTSSATARDGVKMRATRSMAECHSRTTALKAASSPARSAATSCSSGSDHSGERTTVRDENQRRRGPKGRVLGAPAVAVTPAVSHRRP